MNWRTSRNNRERGARGPLCFRGIGRLILLVAGCLACAWSADVARAQARIDAEAYTGRPFGVGRITISTGGDFRGPLVGKDRPRLLRPRADNARGGRLAELAKKVVQQVAGGEAQQPGSIDVALSEQNQRTYYPVFASNERPILRQFIDLPTEVTVYFLFQGDDPLELAVYSPDANSGRIAPRRDAEKYDRLLQAWWREYAAAAQTSSSKQGDYPSLVDRYLLGTLARRLKLEIPAPPAAQEESKLVAGFKKAFESELKLLTDNATTRQQLTAAILAGNMPQEKATQIIPEELPQPKPELLNPSDVPTEAIAAHVPLECLYVRFGSFPNFLWMRNRMEDWGGQLRDIISARGLDYALNERMQQQLGLRESDLAELYGDQVIADVAMIGTDTFLAEGAAIGMLFQARESALLTVDLTQQRDTALKDHPDGKKQKLKIAGHEASYYSTPDNSVRSFYVVDGDFHLVTTSRQLVEWFLGTGAGTHDSLGASSAFRDARRRLPLDRNDAVFVYLSPEFFHNLFGPHYQIEVKRRMRSTIEIELFQVAQLAARGEGREGNTIDQLVAGGFLPAQFGQRTDGSRLHQVEGRMVDSLRGGRGNFVPVPDIDLGRVTPTEVADYRQFADTYSAEWGPMDPLVVAIGRQALPEGQLERVVLDIQAAPLSKQHIERLSQWLGTPTDQRLSRVNGDVVSFEAVLRGGSLLAGGDEHHLFGALRDADPTVQLAPDAGILARLLTSQWDGLQGYVGAWPNPGFLRLFSGWIDVPVDETGTSRLLTGLWRQRINDFTLLSFHPEILNLAANQLHFEKAPRPAQIWLRADDLANSKLAPRLNAAGYRQAQKIDRGNARFLNSLNEQLHVPLQDCQQEAEKLLAARIISPLAGEYQMRQWPGGHQSWASTALIEQADPAQVPPGYQAPALHWLRGVDLEVSTYGDVLSVHGEMTMPVKTRAEVKQDDEGAPDPNVPKIEVDLGDGAPAPAADAPKIEVDLGELEPVAPVTRPAPAPAPPQVVPAPKPTPGSKAAPAPPKSGRKREL